MTPHAECAKAIRVELKKKWPWVKFSVRSSSFAGGDDVGISWELGPTMKEVKEIGDEYRDGYFDSMEDIYVQFSRKDGKPTVKYVGYRRESDHELLEKIARDACVLLGKEFKGLDQGIGYSDDTLEDKAYYFANMVYSGLSFGPKGYEGIEWADDQTVDVRRMFKAIRSEPASSEAIVMEDGIEIKRNEEKDGIEVYFPAKPAKAVIDKMKDLGFRWSRFSKCWWARYSEELMNLVKEEVLP